MIFNSIFLSICGQSSSSRDRSVQELKANSQLQDFQAECDEGCRLWGFCLSYHLSIKACTPAFQDFVVDPLIYSSKKIKLCSKTSALGKDVDYEWAAPISGNETMPLPA